MLLHASTELLKRLRNYPPTIPLGLDHQETPSSPPDCGSAGSRPGPWRSGRGEGVDGAGPAWGRPRHPTDKLHDHAAIALFPRLNCPTQHWFWMTESGMGPSTYSHLASCAVHRWRRSGPGRSALKLSSRRCYTVIAFQRILIRWKFRSICGCYQPGGASPPTTTAAIAGIISRALSTSVRWDQLQRLVASQTGPRFKTARRSSSNFVDWSSHRAFRWESTFSGHRPVRLLDIELTIAPPPSPISYESVVPDQTFITDV